MQQRLCTSGSHFFSDHLRVDVVSVQPSKWFAFWCVTDLSCVRHWASFLHTASFCFKSLAQFGGRVCSCWVGGWESNLPVAVAPAELAALMHHGIILDRCCYLCSMSKPIILTQIYVNTAVSWHRTRFTHAQGGS